MSMRYHLLYRLVICRPENQSTFREQSPLVRTCKYYDEMLRHVLMWKDVGHEVEILRGILVAAHSEIKGGSPEDTKLNE
jgi:hypothetical protein